MAIYTGCFFRMVPPQKVLSVEDGKIPTKKVKVGLFNSKMLSFNSDFHFFGRDLPSSTLRTFWGGTFRKKHPVSYMGGHVFKNHFTICWISFLGSLLLKFLEYFLRITIVKLTWIFLRITISKISCRGRQVDKQEAKKKLFLDFQVLYLWILSIILQYFQYSVFGFGYLAELLTFGIFRYFQ